MKKRLNKNIYYKDYLIKKTTKKCYWPKVRAKANSDRKKYIPNIIYQSKKTQKNVCYKKQKENYQPRVRVRSDSDRKKKN